jgi:hypothetical protein
MGKSSSLLKPCLCVFSFTIVLDLCFFATEFVVFSVEYRLDAAGSTSDCFLRDYHRERDRGRDQNACVQHPGNIESLQYHPVAGRREGKGTSYY